MNPDARWSMVGPTRQGPGGTWARVRSEEGEVHVRLAFRSDLVDHASLQDGILAVQRFLVDPGVPGVATLVAWERTRAAFVYPIGRGVLLADFLDERPQAGLRAALELLVALGPTLDRAHNAGRPYGLTNHGALSPWRIVIHPTHEVSVVGYGVAAAEVTSWLDEETNSEPGPALRFFPPERIEDQAEDVRADIYAAGVCAAELALGRPMLTGDPVQVVDAILEGRIAQDLLGVPDTDLPPDVKRLFVQIVSKDPENRFANGSAMARLAKSLLPSIDGPTLFDVEWAEEPAVEEEPSPSREVPKARSLAAQPDPAPGAATERAVSLVASFAASMPKPIPDLSEDPSIGEIRQVAESTLQRLQQQIDAAADSPGRNRAERALATAQRSHQILRIDDDVAAGRISLDLLRSSVRQGTRALESNQTSGASGVAPVETMDPTTLRQWTELMTQGASEAASRAEARVSQLEHAQRKGQLSASGTLAWFERAVAAAEASHHAAEVTRARAEALVEADPEAVEALRAEVDQQAQQAREQCEQSLVAADEAVALERRTKREADKVGARLEAEGRLVIEEARRAVERIQAHTPPLGEGLYGDNAASEVFAGCRRALSAAELTAARLGRLIKDARLQRGSAGTRGLVEAATEALEELRREVADTVSACDRAMTLLDAESQAQAHVGQLVEPAEARVGKARVRVQALRQELDSVLEETSELSDETWTAQASEAAELVAAAERDLPAIEKLQRSLRVALNEATVRRKLPELEGLVTTTEAHLDPAETSVAALRTAADERLAKHDRVQRQRDSVQQAASDAEQNAKACEALMLGANQLFDQRAADFAKTPDLEVRRLLDEAVARVAEAQKHADLARQAADLAGAATSALDAREQSQVTATCLEMVSSILPDALEGLDQADQASLLAAQRLENARRLGEEATEAFAELVRESQALAEPRIERARPWLTVPAVERAGKLVQTLLATLHAERSDLAVAVEALHADPPDPWATTSAVDQAQATLERIGLHRRRVDGALEALSHTVVEAQAAAEKIEQARAELQRTRQAIGADRVRVDGAIETLERARNQYLADGEPVITAIDALDASRRSIQATYDEVASVIANGLAVSSLAEAEALLEQASTLRTTSEAAADRAMDAEASGVLAARQEAEQREAEEQRQLTAARDEIRSAEARIAERIGLIDEAIGQVRDLGCDTTLPEFREAIRLHSQLQLRRAMIEGLIVQADTLDDRVALISLGQQAREALNEAEQLTSDARVALETAQDHARRAAAEAEALLQVRAEVKALVEQAEAEVQRAREEAERFLEIIREAPLTEVRPLADAAARHIQAATTAAARVRTASPLAVSAENLDAAQTILRRSRDGTQQAREAADAVQMLVEEGLERLRQEREEAQRLLDDARHRALVPLQQAQAARKKAEAWLDSGREESVAANVPLDATSPWGAFESSVGIVVEHGRLADDAAADLEAAESVAEVDGIALRIASASERTVEAAQDAKAALETLRSHITSERAAAELRRTQARHVGEQAIRATQNADQAEAMVRDLDQLAEHLGVPVPRTVRSAIDAVRAEAATVRFSAARAEQAGQQVREAQDDLEAAACAQDVSRAVQSAALGLRRVTELEQVARDAIGEAREAREAEQRQVQALERQRADAASRRAADERRQREAADRAARAERERRQEARRARLQRNHEDEIPRFTDLDERGGAASRRSGLGRPLSSGASRTGLYARTGDGESSGQGRTGNVWPPPRRTGTDPGLRRPRETSGDDLFLDEAPADDPFTEGNRSTAEKVDALLSRLRARRMKDS